jgi:hypothetical protein
MFKKINNFLDENTFNNFKELLLWNKFPWFYQHTVGTSLDESDFYFCHYLFNEQGQCSQYFPKIVMPILGKLSFNNLLRAKANLYTKKSKEIQTEFHIDSENPHTVALYSINKNNGYTFFEDGTKIFSEENTCIIFDGKIKHCSVSQTDTSIRVNININLC